MATPTDNTRDGWSENLSSAEDPFLIYFCSELLSDVTLIVGADKKRIPGHKLILSQCSWEFFNVFHNIKLDKDELMIEGVAEDIFLCFLKFCYTKKLELDGVDGLSVLKLAYRFQVKPLIEKCETHLCEVMKKENCLDFYISSSFLNPDSKLKTKIFRQIELYFKWLTWDKDQKQKFNNLPLEALRKFVVLENFDCDEMQLFDGIINWAKFNCEKNNISTEPQNLRRILRDVFYRIRFPTMKLDWFVEVVSQYPKLFTTEEISVILMGIKSDKKPRSMFSHKFRKHGYSFVRDPFTLDWGITGNKIKCFSGPFQLRSDTSSEMSIKFFSSHPKVLLGFAFISKRCQAQRILSCEIENSFDYGSTRETRIKKNWTLNWDYCLTIVVFRQTVELLRNEWYKMHCKLGCDMVNVKLDPPYSTDDFNSEGIFIKKGEYNIIPYLIFE